MNIVKLLNLMGPVILAAVLHMAAIRVNLFPSLTIPVYEKLFGANKTYRGFVLMPFFGIISIIPFTFSETFTSALPMGTNFITLGAILGFVYVLFELPNSYLKRKIGIAPGEQSKDYQLLFFILDRIDSALGVALTYFLFGTGIEIFWILPFALLIHPMITIPLYFAGIKQKIL